MRDKADCAELPVTEIRGVGPQFASRLARLGISTVQDLLFHLPFRYEDRTRRTAIGAASPGERALLVGRIEQSAVTYGRRRSLVSRLGDGTGWIDLRLFYFSKAQQNDLRRGNWVRCFGEVRRGRSALEIVHPEYRVFQHEPEDDPSGTLTPVYPTTESISQAALRRVINNAVAAHARSLSELIPGELLEPMELPTLQRAVVELHQPDAGADVGVLQSGQAPAQRRLALEELLAHHLSFLKLRAHRNTQRAPVLGDAGGRVPGLVSSLGFELTGAQRRALGEVLRDLGRPLPMLRLVQGDVGSGKTVIAAAAMVRAAENGLQAAVLAPTELLAEQHYRTLAGWMEPLEIEVEFLSSRLAAGDRRRVLARLEGGRAQVAVGTHALFQRGVEFQRLGLVVVDEQHRFGVDQRLAMLDKGSGDGDLAPHQLVMTATPIPRTLAMTFYTELDVSSIDELPPGRSPVDTVVVPERRRAEVIERIRHALAAGRQVYWVCPLIEESEALSARDVTGARKDLLAAIPAARVGLVHGRMKPKEKDQVMTAFRDRELDVLVATTVIEVGVDVPNASLMVIENAERLGLSQLHQLRGRVGRGSQQSACVLLYQSPLSEHARVRLAALRKTNDGFEIARQDLALRGPGEVLGTRQTGALRMRVADLVRDRALLESVPALGRLMAQRHPDRVAALIRRWVRQDEQYGQV